MIKKAKKPAKKAVAKAKGKKAKAATKTKSKATKNSKVKKAATKKSPVKAKAANKRSAVKAKVPVKKSVKASVGIATKRPAGKAKSNVGNKSKASKKPITEPVIIPHGEDQHFIPMSTKNAPSITPDGKIVEQQFHNHEETAMRQENQKAKSAMASRIGRKRIFKILGR